MPAPDEAPSRSRAWLIGLILPPVGLFLLWRGRRGLLAKLLGSVGLLLLSLVDAALIILFLIQFTGLEIEWRGGFLPALTWNVTRPDYEALESSRARVPVVSKARSTPVPGTASWTGFRGPAGNGCYDQEPILTNWPAQGLPLLWRQPSGGGYSSYAITGGLAFTLEQRRDREALVAYDVNSGAEVWSDSWPGRFKEYYSEEGPRSTPVISDGLVYSLGALGELRCLEVATGKRVWAMNIASEAGSKVPTYGFSASPLILGQGLLVLAGASQGKSLLCLDKRTGKPLWAALNDSLSYATPMEVSLAGERQLLICTGKRAVGLGIPDGRLLWEYPWRPENGPAQIAQPVVLGTNRFLLSAGYFTGCAAVEVNHDGTNFSTRTVWQNKHLKNKFTSSVFWQGYIYGLDEDTLTCLDARTGERKWRAGKYGYGQLLLASGHLVILSGSGELALVKAVPDGHLELARFRAIKGKTWNHLALAEGRLLVRNATEMACFRIQ